MARLLIAICVALATPSSSWAQASAGNAVSQSGQFTLRTDSLEGFGDGVVVRGSVCRRGFSAGRPRFVRVDRLGEDGATLATIAAPVRAAPGYRGGCGFFAAFMPGIDASDWGRLRATAARSRPRTLPAVTDPN